MDQQAYPLTSASHSIVLKPRSPSARGSDSASLRLDSGSVISVTDSERTLSAVESSYDTCSENSSLRSVDPGSSEYLAHSVRTLFSRIQNFNPSVTRPAVYPQDIKDAANLLASDLIIAFVGPTGSGKSNIIDTITRQPGQHAGSRLGSCTTQVRAVRLFNDPTYGDRLVLVDTPGFDDTHTSDLEVLEMISKWLQEVYGNGIKLAGIVYLHRITDNRMAGTPHRNLRMFGELCGGHAVKKVVLATTMWDEVYSSGMQEMHIQQEKELFDNDWKLMIDYGATTARFTNSPESAWKLIATCLRNQEAEVLLLRGELLELRKALNETQAGKTLYSDLQKLLAEQQDTLRSLAQQARDENSLNLAVQLDAELKHIQMKFDKTFEEMRNLNIPIGKRIMLSFSRKNLTRARAMRF